MKSLISIGVAAMLATPLMFNTTKVRADAVADGPSAEVPADPGVLFGPAAVYAATVATVRLAMMVASLSATDPKSEPVDQAENAFD
ncbi:MAG: hypothetical protein JNK45_05595 [Myxococcales bacterium]|jgi:hypothetical protein|nr:hypothetical protein [Myxococcales bacterium]